MHKCCTCGKDFQCSKDCCSWPYAGDVPCEDCAVKARKVIREMADIIRRRDNRAVGISEDY